MPRPTYGLDDFLRDLEEKTKREGTEWKLTACGRIRLKVAGAPAFLPCPLAYLTGEPLGYERAMRKRGMRVRDIDAVMAAADFQSPGKKFLPLRRQLLKITEAA